MLDIINCMTKTVHASVAEGARTKWPDGAFMLTPARPGIVRGLFKLVPRKLGPPPTFDRRTQTLIDGPVTEVRSDHTLAPRIVVDRALDSVKAEMEADLKRERDARQYADIEMYGARFKATAESQWKIEAAARGSANARWKCKNRNGARTHMDLTPGQLEQLGAAIAERTRMIYENEERLLASIDRSKTVADLRSLDMEEGWSS